ncbi:DoxX family membrane protein [Heyndrickxia ginsengihumi]|uniref:DoxX family membrane protein n=1 Tax=Heyndrickxia ginsengihumi TaxID=363870 RepID=UPI00046FBF29|nr:DoxX family protein [Heyndrickxia ginsengihumi]
MVIQFFRQNKYISILLVILRVYVGYTWMMAGLEKLEAKHFSAYSFLHSALVQASGEHPAVQQWWAEIVKHAIIPNIALFNMLVPWGELFVGIGILVGCFTKTVVFFAMVMNFSYMFSGSVSTNPQLILLSMFILVSAANAGRYGIDGFVLPYFKEKLFMNKTREKKVAA